MNSTPTSQMIRGESRVQTGNWAKMFPSKIESDVRSCTFVKKLITVALSNITYLRSMFPEEAYANRSLDGLSLKILREKNNCKEAKTLASWLLGAFEALEKKYLRELTLNVYLDDSSQDTVHEKYNFKFSYPGGMTKCTVMQEGDMNDVNNVNYDDIYKSTQNLLRTLVVLTQGLDPLPGSASLTMKLSYYDETTPEDYEPAGFKATDLADQEKSKGSRRIKVGEVSSSHHSLKLRVHITPKQLGETMNEHVTESNTDLNHNVPEQSEMDQQDVVTTSNLPPSQSSIIQSSQTKVIPDASSTVPPELSVSLLQDSQPQVQHPVPSFDQNSQSNVISCTCLNTQPDSLMLTCHHCGQRQHAACYRIIEEDKIPSQHICVTCSITESIACTDPKLVKMSNKPAVHLTCIYRRVIAALLTTEFVNQDWICTNIGVSVMMAGQIISKLSTENCVQESGGGWYSVDMKTLQMLALPKYLGVKRVIGSTLESIVEKTEDMKIENKEKLNIYRGNVSSKRSINVAEDEKRSKRMKVSRSKYDIPV